MVQSVTKKDATENERDKDNKRRRLQVLSLKEMMLETLQRTLGAASERERRSQCDAEAFGIR